MAGHDEVSKISCKHTYWYVYKVDAVEDPKLYRVFMKCIYCGESRRRGAVDYGGWCDKHKEAIPAPHVVSRVTKKPLLKCSGCIKDDKW